MPVGPVAYDFIRARPEARLFYPGSAVIFRGGRSESKDLSGGVHEAYANAVLTTGSGPGDVYAWYLSKLTKEGWTSSGPTITASFELSAQGFERGPRELIVVAIDDPQLAKYVIGRPSPPGVTLYEYRYVIWPTSLAESSPSPH